MKSSFRRSVFRNILIVFQFAVSVFLIFGTYVVYNQLNYIRNKDLGFKKENIVMFPIMSQAVGRQIESFKSEVLRNPNILSAAASESYPTAGHGNISTWWEGKKDEVTLIMPSISIDHNFLKTFRLELIAGRDFSKDIESDRMYAYILNETAVKQLGWKDPIGKQFQVERAGYPRGTVIGVVKDFNFDSLRSEIRPLALINDPSLFNYLCMKIAPDNIPETIQYIEKKFKDFDPTAPFEYTFLDGRLDRIYKAEQRIGQIFNSFSLLAIFIACLGLLGLASLAITLRTKEVGIRKVLGASTSRIVILLTREFTVLVLVSNIIAWPAAYFVMHKWLQNFAFRINISVWVFLLSGLTVIFIALLTISFKAIKTAIANPVNSLRYE
jgi:putative ABC transport system permease protein